MSSDFKSYIDIYGQPVDSNEEDDWWKEARQTLWNLKNNFCPADYDEYVMSNVPQLDERELLTIKLCFLMFGQPIEDETKRDNRYELQLEEEYEELIREVEGDSLAILSLYQPKQVKKAKKLTKSICSLERKTPDKLHAAIIFVCLRMFDSKVDTKALPIPIIRVLREPKSEDGKEDLCWFVDLDGRAYKNWENYLSSNKLPEGEICYPIHGIYSTRPINENEEDSSALLLGRAQTPACSMVNKVLNVANTAMTIASFGALAIAVAGLAITVTPVVATAGAGVGAASMIYGGTRAVTTLVDRGQHKQTLAPVDAESRIAWLGIAGAALATGSAQATQALADLATNADKVGKSMEYTVNFVNTSSIGISAIGVVNHGYMIIKNYQEDQTISAFDLMQLSLSALLLTHSLVNFHTAKQIMKDAKTTSLSEFENHLNDKKHRHDFKHVKDALKTIKLDKLKKRPRTIRTIRQIDDPREFFYKAYEITNIDVEDRIGNFKFDNNGNFIICDKKFGADKLLKLNSTEQIQLLRDLKLVNKGEISENDVAENVQNWIDRHIDMEQKIENILESIPALQDKDSQPNLNELKSHISAIAKILESNDDRDNLQEIMNLSVDICQSMGFTSYRSLFQIMVIIQRSVKSNEHQSSSETIKILSNTFLKTEIYSCILENYFAQMNAADANFQWKYHNPVFARRDYDNYKNAIKSLSREPLTVKEYWKELQSFFEQNEAYDVKEHENTNLILSYQNQKYKGEVYQFSGENANQFVLFFGWRHLNEKTFELAYSKCL